MCKSGRRRFQYLLWLKVGEYGLGICNSALIHCPLPGWGKSVCSQHQRIALCPPSSLLLLCFLSSPLSCPPCIDPYPILEEQRRDIGDDKGFQIGNSPHQCDILPSLNMKCSYLLISKILSFWYKRLWWSLRLLVGQLKLIIRYFPGQQPEEGSV